MRKSAEINAEIYNHGAGVFDAVCQAVMQEATWDQSAAVHEANQRKLTAKVDGLMAETANMLRRLEEKGLDQEALWQLMWRRIVYAYTISAKASAEIESLSRMIGLFQGLDGYVQGRFEFDKKEWASFTAKWKKITRRKDDWLNVAKQSPQWDPGAELKLTTPEVWQILLKDDTAYPGLRFSAHPDKVIKYLKMARRLRERRDEGQTNALAHYLKGVPISRDHLEGQEWVREREGLAKVRNVFEKEVGLLTGMHIMMDLGLKTIKPDRVMTYLFSQLGWLQTLPASLSKKQVQDVYTRKNVVDEMTVRSDVLALRLALDKYEQTHRLLDIWFVKFGQEPEPEWGLTRTLQGSDARSKLPGRHHRNRATSTG